MCQLQKVNNADSNDWLGCDRPCWFLYAEIAKEPDARLSVNHFRQFIQNPCISSPLQIVFIMFAGIPLGDRQIVTGINFAPTLVDPFRALGAYGIGLNGLLSNLYAHPDDPVTVVVHLACPHLNYTDRGKSSLEAI